MSYLNAKEILPKDILELLQQYVEGACLYIPQKAENRQPWGSQTTFKSELERRNAAIFEGYCNGQSTKVLSETFFLSEKSIQRIVLQLKKQHWHEPESL